MRTTNDRTDEDDDEDKDGGMDVPISIWCCSYCQVVDTDKTGWEYLGMGQALCPRCKNQR